MREEMNNFLEVALSRSFCEPNTCYSSPEDVMFPISKTSTEQLDVGAFLVFLGNNNIKDVESFVLQIVNTLSQTSDILSFFDRVLSSCSEMYGDTISRLLLLDTFALTYDFHSQKFSLNEIMDEHLGPTWSKGIRKKDRISLNDTLPKIFAFFFHLKGRMLFTSAETHLLFLTMSEEESKEKIVIGSMLFNMSMPYGGISYAPLSVIENDSICFSEVYVFKNGLSYISFDFMHCIKENKKIKICKNCNKYFIPISKSNEIYCDNIYINNKTCRQVGYENKLNADEVLKTYRTAYKTQNARKSRNKHLPDIEQRFKAWHNEAKNRLKYVQNGTLTMSEFKEWLNSDWWLKKHMREGE